MQGLLKWRPRCRRSPTNVMAMMTSARILNVAVAAWRNAVICRRSVRRQPGTTVMRRVRLKRGRVRLARQKAVAVRKVDVRRASARVLTVRKENVASMVRAATSHAAIGHALMAHAAMAHVPTNLGAILAAAAAARHGLTVRRVSAGSINHAVIVRPVIVQQVIVRAVTVRKAVVPRVIVPRVSAALTNLVAIASKESVRGVMHPVAIAVALPSHRRPVVSRGIIGGTIALRTAVHAPFATAHRQNAAMTVLATLNVLHLVFR